MIIFVDTEAGNPSTDPKASFVAKDFIKCYYDTMTAGGRYKPGFYGNPIAANGQFAGAFCGAVSDDAKYGNSYLYASNPEPGRTSKANMPNFAPAPSSCSSQEVAWQYGISNGNSPDVDTDEFKSSSAGTLLW